MIHCFNMRKFSSTEFSEKIESATLIEISSLLEKISRGYLCTAEYELPNQYPSLPTLSHIAFPSFLLPFIFSFMVSCKLVFAKPENLQMWIPSKPATFVLTTTQRVPNAMDVWNTLGSRTMYNDCSTCS